MKESNNYHVTTLLPAAELPLANAWLTFPPCFSYRKYKYKTNVKLVISLEEIRYSTYHCGCVPRE